LTPGTVNLSCINTGMQIEIASWGKNEPKKGFSNK